MSNVASSTLPRSWWWGFALYAVVAAEHVIGLLIPNWSFTTASKLLLMPLLAAAVLWASQGEREPARERVLAILILALTFAWLGDGAGTLFPFLPELPVMLACFAVTHLLYIWLFSRRLAVRRMSAWAALYLLWWIVLLAALWTSLGALAIAVALYGIVLGGTAATATACTSLIRWGAVAFLTSDSILAFELFRPELTPSWTGSLVMLSYCLGQGMIALGVVRTRTLRRTPSQATA